MRLQQNLGIKLSQNVLMTAELQQSIKLLQMGALELQEFVDNEILENPCLKSTEDMHEVDSDTSEHKEELDFDAHEDDLYEPSSHYESANFSEETYNLEHFVSNEETLHQHLRQQLAVFGELSPKQDFLCKYLIDGISDSGYLSYDLEKEASFLKVKKQLLEECLNIIQGFSPDGVGARDLRECLILQAKYSGKYDAKMSVLLDNLDILAKKDLKQLRKLMKVTHEELIGYAGQITKFNPKPGLAYGSDTSRDVIPDVIIKKDSKGNLKVELNSASLPRVALNDIYKKKDFSARGDKKFIGEKISRANWLVRSIHQRQDTIYRTAQALLKLQRNFFLFGPEGLQPLTLKNVAEMIEVHESTVSRISNEKFVQTEFGVFPIKYFFASGVATMAGKQMVGADAVKRMIKRIVEAENDEKPYSDERLVSLLQDEGVELARRTVAKYRESLHIPSSSRRRVRV
ncbi:MAG: RNA polymerase factor sigma-54 [Proteobacteria bacterium]|nr:RNA polymerase factor sigma-54 [Pseudomonadota bacterium]